jgi:hypothetical protein
MAALIERLQARLDVEREPLARAELLARLACCLARYGQFDRADQVVSEVRGLFGENRSGRVTCLVMVAEAVQHSFLQRQPEALDRLKRAQMLAQMGRDQELIGLASAWRAHVEFEASWFDAAARSIRTALDSLTAEDRPTISRVAVVLHNAFSLIGDEEARMHWYARGRKSALEDGDEATIDALLHSKTSFGVAHELARRAMGEPQSRPLDLLAAEVKSARNLQRLMQVEAHASYVELVHARSLILVDKFGEALGHLERISDPTKFPSQHLNSQALKIATWLCRSRVGQCVVDRDELFDPSVAEGISKLDPDDRLIAMWMLYQLLADFGSPSEAATSLLEQARQDYLSYATQVRSYFDAFRLAR